MPFSEQVGISERVEKLENLSRSDDPIYRSVWERVNSRLGTTAFSIPELISQLGIARFGRRPTVGDPFCGGGSIPFEAARIGCDIVASDLNPIASMLTWGALNIIGADTDTRNRLYEEQSRASEVVYEEIVRLGVEHDINGNRAKAYLYCLEVVDPQTGWRIPLAPSWVISMSRRCIGKLIRDYSRKRFNIVVEDNVSEADMAKAALGTVRGQHLIYNLAPIEGGEEQEYRISIARLRGDGEGVVSPESGVGNRLRRWEIDDIVPQEPTWAESATPVIDGAPPGAWVGGDIWLERLYAIQWISGEDLKLGKSRPKNWFAAPDAEDLRREAKVLACVEMHRLEWQEKGFIPDMRIEPGEKTDEPIRTRGWTYWHHLFGPRHLLIGALIRKANSNTPLGLIETADALNRMSRLSRWETGSAGPNGGPMDRAKDVFSNQALNTLYNYAARATVGFANSQLENIPLHTSRSVVVRSADTLAEICDLWIFDPPYADAVHYHEITEFFISWLRKRPPSPFDKWIWDSRRPLAIQGKGERFRSDMVHAFAAMAERMPHNGLQICMFTHQDAGVWADMAQIVWSAGLCVTAAWYVSTETASELKKGGYVQGTVLLVLRRRPEELRGYKDEIVLEVRGAVQRQVELLTGLNQRARARQRDENPFSDADIQMAGYAAALEVLTGYTHIEGADMTREVLRPRVKGEKGIVEEMIDLAVQTATEMMRPEGISEPLWERMVPTERFWLKMMEAESSRPAGQPGGKLDDYQNFAKAYRADGWEDLMADSTPNKARLKGAAEFRRAMMSGHPFAGGMVRPVLYAVNELRAAAEKEEDSNVSNERAINGLRDNLGSWARQRENARVIAEWLGRILTRHRPGEASAARTLAALIRTERLS
jgi:putative DNA methylase